MIKLVLIFGVLRTLALADDRIVQTAQGPVRGYRPEGEDYFVFNGIPYATAPTGANRFGAPLPPPVWNEPYEAVENYVICPQNPRVQDAKLNVQENCLITNIYVPDTNNTNLPVLVHVHGGAYQAGYGNVKTAIHLMKSKEFIFVSFNYRVGAHGFLCLGTTDVPGNAGTKDQVALLRWIQKNIAYFGGSPNDVTISGSSAGSASVDLISISKMSKGLFHKVIVQSGSVGSSFSVQVDPLANAKMIASQLGLDDVDDISKLEEFYKKAPYEMLFSVDVGNTPDSSTVFAPCVERNVGQEMFLDDYPINILKSDNFSKVPMLYGTTNMEGLFRRRFFDSWKDMMNENFSDFLPEDLVFKNEEEKKDVASLVKHFYFGDDPVSEENILSYIQYFTDVMFSYGTARAVSLQVAAGNSELYLYEYAFASDTVYMNNTEIRGATHSSQSDAIWDSQDEESLSDEYKNMKKVMRSLWLNFITTGQPVPDSSSYPSWPPVGRHRTPYMVLDSVLSLEKHYLNKRALIWDTIYKKHYRHPISP